MKRLIKNIPELYFIVIGFIWFLDSLFVHHTINYIAVLLIWLLLVQIVYKNKIIGIFYSVILLLTNLYILSELISFEAFSVDTLNVIIGRGIICFVSLIMSFAMFLKFYSSRNYYRESVLTISS